MESEKEKVIAQVKQLEEKLGRSCQSIQQLSSYVDKVHASLAASSYSRFIEQEIAEEPHQRATFSEGTLSATTEGKSSERTVLALEVLRTAINFGIENIAQLKEDIKEVSSVPDLISHTPNMSARGPSSDNLGDSTPSAENIRGSTSIARESGVEQETAPDDAGKVKKSMHDETATTDDVHAQTDLIPIPTTTGSEPKSLSSSEAVPSESDRSFLVASSNPRLSGSGSKNLFSSGAAPSDQDHSFLVVSSTSELSGSGPKDVSSFIGTVPSDLDRSFLIASSTSELSGAAPKTVSSSVSGTVPSELDRSFLVCTSGAEFSDSLGKSLTTSSGTVPSELNKSFLLPTSEISGSSSFFKGIDAGDDSGRRGSSSFFKGIDAGDDSGRRESAGQGLTSSSSRTVPSELDRSFLLPSSASDISDLSHFLTKSHDEHSNNKEESEKKENTSVVEASKNLPSEPLCPKKITDKYKSIFDDEDDDDDLFDIKSKKTQKEVSAPSTKPSPKKLQDSNFSKLLGEKLARGPAQPVKSQTPITASKSDDSRIMVSNTPKVDKLEDKKPDSYEPLHSIAKQRTRGPARRPPSKRRTALPDPVELSTDDVRNLAIQSETNSEPAAASADTAKLPKEDVTRVTTRTETNTVSKIEAAEDADAASKKTSSRAEVVQRSAVQSFFDADSDEDDKEENQPPKKSEQSSDPEVAEVKPRPTTARAPSSITAQSLFADDDDSDLSLFRKK